MAQVAEADRIASGNVSSSGEFVQAVWAADFLCSDRMYQANRLPRLLDNIGSMAWKGEVDQFYELARFESHRNSMLRRWVRRKWYDGAPRDVSRSRLAKLDLSLRTDDRGAS